jgi:hypothetical protein
MLAIGLISLVDKSNWINIMVIQNEMVIDDIRVCVDYQISLFLCAWSFSYPFQWWGAWSSCDKNAYSFTNEFLGYQQV